MNFIEKLQNCMYILKATEITNCEDAIKIHSLIHNYCAPVFYNMLKYGLYLK